MGVERDAMMVIGVDVSGKVAKKHRKTVPNCVHQQPAVTKNFTGALAGVTVQSEPKFCAECGQPVGFKTVDSVVDLIPGLDPHEDTWEGFEVIRQSYYDDTVSGKIFIGYSYQTNDQPKKASVNPEVVKAELKAALDPVGLWDEEKFGIYVMMMWS